MNNIVGYNLKKRRKDAGLTQKQLAGYAQVSPATITCIEQGISNASRATLLKLADALGCSVNDLEDQNAESFEKLNELANEYERLQHKRWLGTDDCGGLSRVNYDEYVKCLVAIANEVAELKRNGYLDFSRSWRRYFDE